jgi:hypothetical protein
MLTCWMRHFMSQDDGVSLFYKPEFVDSPNGDRPYRCREERLPRRVCQSPVLLARLSE